MPEKSVREMSAIERKHHSLSARTFHAVLLLSVILSVAAIAFGFYLYINTVRTQYTEKAADAAKTVAAIVNGDELIAYSENILKKYESLPDDVKSDQSSDAYLAEFGDIRGETLDELTELLAKVRDANGLVSAYIGISDTSERNFIFVSNSDPTQDFRQIGRFMPLEEKYRTAFSKNFSVIPALIAKTDDGYFCTGSEPIYTSDGRIAGYAVANISLSAVADAARAFLWQFCLLLAAVAIVSAYFMVRRLKKTVVKPINAIADAAAEYVNDKKNGAAYTEHFARLGIRTGDEVENLSLVMADMERDISQIEADLSKANAEKERIGTELALATRIQADMLPNIFPAFPERNEFDIYASMTPAKEVGGDFYDFFLIDEDHLGIVIADVSGKGIPAALFMMISKILVQNVAMSGKSPAEVLRTVNEQICSNNREEMFVTVWLGILDLTNGKLTAANAGHEYPILKTPSGDFEAIKDKHGFVVGGMAGAKYKEYELTLAPDSKLFLYTDGVAEATNAESEMFGIDRTVAALNMVKEAEPQKIIESISKKVKIFVGDAPQFDDLTMLCVHYIGRETKNEKADCKSNR